MSNYRVVDKDKKATWVINQGEHRLPDYGRQAEIPGSDLVILEPGEPTRIIYNDFLKANPTIVEIEDPTQSEGIVVKEKKVETTKAKAGDGDKPADDKPAA